MKKNIHPPYQDILIIDSSTGVKYICSSTLQPKEFEMFEGKQYPVYRVSISSASHPFYTGSGQRVDSEGRVKLFQNRYKKAFQAQQKDLEQKKAKETIKSKKFGANSRPNKSKDSK